MSRPVEVLYQEAEADLAAVMREIDQAKHGRTDLRKVLQNATRQTHRVAGLEARITQLQTLLEEAHDRTHELTLKLAEAEARGAAYAAMPADVVELREIVRVQDIELRALRQLAYAPKRTLVITNAKAAA
jgi:chromosome segregation ATPase